MAGAGGGEPRGRGGCYIVKEPKSAAHIGSGPSGDAKPRWRLKVLPGCRDASLIVQRSAGGFRFSPQFFISFFSSVSKSRTLQGAAFGVRAQAGSQNISGREVRMLMVRARAKR